VPDHEGAPQRPQGRNDGTQRWRDLLFLHWPVPKASLTSLLPPSLDVDTFDGQAWLGIVPFTMLDVKPRWLPGRGLSFLETNVRTYVHRDGRDPGVWFFSLDAASWLAVQAARLGWSLPYYHAKMSTTEADDIISYETRRADGVGIDCRYRRLGPLGPSEVGGLQHFFLERYVLYASRRGQLVRGQVHHDPYPAYGAELLSHSQNLSTASRIPVQGAPTHVHASPGVDVEVFGIRPC
jgi:uncharacterized protein YqjF (DUF2071 family)